MLFTRGGRLEYEPHYRLMSLVLVVTLNVLSLTIMRFYVYKIYMKISYSAKIFFSIIIFKNHANILSNSFNLCCKFILFDNLYIHFFMYVQIECF